MFYSSPTHSRCLAIVYRVNAWRKACHCGLIQKDYQREGGKKKSSRFKRGNDGEMGLVSSHWQGAREPGAGHRLTGPPRPHSTLTGKSSRLSCRRELTSHLTPLGLPPTEALLEVCHLDITDGKAHKNIYNEQWLNVPFLFIQENIKINTPKYYKIFIYKNEHSPKILKSGLKKKLPKI